MPKNSIRSRKLQTAKKPHHSNIVRDKDAKIVVIEEYLNMKDLQKHVVTNFYLERLAQELHEWASNNSTALKISTFFKERGVSGTTLDRWRKLSPVFDEAYIDAKEIIGDRRELGIFNEGFPENFVKHSMALYDKEWKQLEEWRSKLKESGSQHETKIVVIDNYSSDKVPSKKED